MRASGRSALASCHKAAGMIKCQYREKQIKQRTHQVVEHHAGRVVTAAKAEDQDEVCCVHDGRVDLGLAVQLLQQEACVRHCLLWWEMVCAHTLALPHSMSVLAAARSLLRSTPALAQVRRHACMTV